MARPSLIYLNNCAALYAALVLPCNQMLCYKAAVCAAFCAAILLCKT